MLESILGGSGAEYMMYLNDMPSQLVEAMSFRVENIHVFIAMAIAYITGFLLYIQANKVAAKQGVQPYPLWIHCYMMSIDSIGAITYGYLAFTHDFFWYFDFQCVALVGWLALEFMSIKKGLADAQERGFEFGNLMKGGITKKKATMYCVAIYVVGLFLNMYALALIGGIANAAIYIIYPFTNYVYAIFTWRFWDARSAEYGNRKYNALSLQIVITVTCFVSWCPGISWYWTVSPYFHQIWFILPGLVCTLVSCYNLYRCYKLPKYDPKTDPESPLYEGGKATA